jgi:hypothetical protein
MATHTYDDIDIDEVMTARREKLLLERADLQAKIDEVDKRIRRIERYFADAPAAKPRAASTRAPRGELGGFRKEVYDFVAQHPKGLEAGPVQAHFKGSVKATKISAALFNLKKQGRLVQPDGDRGRYVVVEKSTSEEAPDAHPEPSV